MEHNWHEIVKEIVTDRVKVLPSVTRVDLFLELENRANTHPLITNIFMTEATTALDELIFRQVSSCVAHYVTDNDSLLVHVSTACTQL